MTEIQKLTIPNCKDTKQMGVSFIAGGHAKWYNHFGRQFDRQFLLKLSISSYASANHIHRYLPNWFEKFCPQKSKPVNSSFIYNCPNGNNQDVLQ